MDRRLRVLLGKPGLDGHDRGALVVARALRDAGFEVIYSGLHQTPEMLVNVAIQEAVDCIGLSIMSGAHDYLMPEVVRLLAQRGASDIFVFGGGIIPDEDVPPLLEAGVVAIFGPGTPTREIVEWLKAEAQSRASA
ncbi:MAG: methylmalonyl-CoA mutase [Deltaproteobacteria bacterium CG2_30_63_29]|nr:MAG: methylmalonyl-CoA mutase [Deltaproteobacteria bacterium CG2_30_63_29]PJB34259.1 MAG: methylmalonyl-CoA mutase [Deltaproteobacteria bacterium CG_4_9_14_3_um_filter_63_12]